MRGAGSKLPDGMHAITAEYWNTTGTALHAYVLLAPGIKTSGSTGTQDAALPKGIEVSHVVWGRELKRAVRDSVNSIFGTMAFPDVTLAVPEEAEQTR